MAAESGITDLAARFDIEAAHTEHVTRLALEIFDGFQPMHGLLENDRRMLFAAARLHDIAYASHPSDHVIAGARILAGNPVNGYSTGDWKVVIGTVLLHHRDWRSMISHAVFPAVNEKELHRVKMLAAILRIADGLDHSHIQDARILFCRRGKNKDKVGVQCAWYPGNISWAEEKADLWETMHKRPFRIKGQVKDHRKVFKGVVYGSDRAITAARRILCSQGCVMRDHVPGMLENRDPECLHQYRVALRRFRAALRMFQPLLADSSAGVINDRLRSLSRALSPVRDAQVVLALFRALTGDGQENRDAGRVLEGEADAAGQIIKHVLDSADFRETVHRINALLRIELPRMERLHPEPSYPDYARNSLDQLIERLTALDVSALQGADPDTMHRVRRLCRRGRYYAEFTAPVLDKSAQTAAELLKHIAGALGDARDLRLLAQTTDIPGLAAPMAQMEAEAWLCFHSEWSRLCTL